MKRLATTLAAPFRRFAGDQGGAVTVDWVVLTAALVAIIMGLFTLLTDSLYEQAGLRIAADVQEASAR